MALAFGHLLMEIVIWDNGKKELFKDKVFIRPLQVIYKLI